MTDVRAWLASAGWACLSGLSASLFLTIALVGLFLVFFGALISAMLAPLLLLLPAEWQWTGWQDEPPRHRSKRSRDITHIAFTGRDIAHGLELAGKRMNGGHEYE